MHLCKICTRAIIKDMSELSTRDLKRQSTAAQIHQVAERMALEQGLAQVKVEDIATAATISRRTFFNYFSTKEDAILGLTQPVLTDEALQVFESSAESLLVRTAGLMVAVKRTTYVAQDSSLKERKLLRERYPELRARFDAYIMAAEQLIRPVVERIAGSDDAEIVMRLASAILRYTYTIDPEMNENSVKRSVDTFSQTINRIS